MTEEIEWMTPQELYEENRSALLKKDPSAAQYLPPWENANAFHRIGWQRVYEGKAFKEMDAARAAEVAAGWGSFVRSGDPGAIFYTLSPREKLLNGESHREALIEYTDGCIEIMKARLADRRYIDGEDEDRVRDMNDLIELLEYFVKAKTEDELVWYTSSDGRVEFQMTRGEAASVSHSGRCDDDVAALLRNESFLDRIKDIDPDAVRDELKGYGAWDAKELADDAANLTRIVWQAGCSISEGQMDDEEN